MTPGLVVYSATKGAVKMFTQGLAREVGPRGITVNNIQPGPIDTDLNPADDEWAEPQLAATALKRYGHVDDIAPMVAFIAGPEAGYITGASLTVRRRNQRLIHRYVGVPADESFDAVVLHGKYAIHRRATNPERRCVIVLALTA